jgi:hypothetical protein
MWGLLGYHIYWRLLLASKRGVRDVVSLAVNMIVPPSEELSLVTYCFYFYLFILVVLEFECL